MRRLWLGENARIDILFATFELHILTRVAIYLIAKDKRVVIKIRISIGLRRIAALQPGCSTPPFQCLPTASAERATKI